MQVLRRAWISGIIFSMIFVFAPSIFAQEANQETAPEAVTPIPQSGTLETAAPTPEAALAPEAAAPEAASTPEVAAPTPQSGTLETAAPTPEAALAPEAAAPEAKPTEWVWGEVVSVDTETKQIVLKHLDYDTYEEVQTTLKVGDKTLFENVAALGEIKPGNHLTADFKIAEGSNIADLIVVEKDVKEEAEALAPQSGTLETAAPEAASTPEAAVPAPEAALAPEAASTPEAALAPEAANVTTPTI